MLARNGKAEEALTFLTDAYHHHRVQSPDQFYIGK